MKLSEKKIILGVGFTIDPIDKILEYISEMVIDGTRKVSVYTTNPEMLIYARSHPQFRSVLNDAQIALPDGMGVVVAARLVGKSVKERIAGVDFMEKVIKMASGDLSKVAKRPVSIGFIGGRDGVAEKSAICLQKKYPGAHFFVYDRDVVPGSFKFQMSQLKHVGSEKGVMVQIPKRLDILFVAFGFPRQEEWIRANLPHIPVTIAMGVGGAFDIFGGKTKRAPKVLQKIGLEWSWRLALQPWRIKRQIKLIQFPSMILKERLKK